MSLSILTILKNKIKDLSTGFKAVVMWGKKRNYSWNRNIIDDLVWQSDAKKYAGKSSLSKLEDAVF